MFHRTNPGAPSTPPNLTSLAHIYNLNEIYFLRAKHPFDVTQGGFITGRLGRDSGLQKDRIGHGKDSRTDTKKLNTP